MTTWAALLRGINLGSHNKVAIYLASPNGSGRSKLNQGLLETRLGVTVTARNWKTVTKLADMVEKR